jgi:hypothetical protein
MGKERKAKKELETKITALESRVQERRVRLGEYNALFMTIEKAEERAAVERGAAPSKDKAARQKLGAREAISGTKRIIEINLNKMENEIATQGMKLNKSRDHNLKLKDKIDALRKEHLTYNKLFASLGHDLEMYKEKVKSEWLGSHTTGRQYYPPSTHPLPLTPYPSPTSTPSRAQGHQGELRGPRPRTGGHGQSAEAV